MFGTFVEYLHKYFEISVYSKIWLTAQNMSHVVKCSALRCAVLYITRHERFNCFIINIIVLYEIRVTSWLVVTKWNGCYRVLLVISPSLCSAFR